MIDEELDAILRGQMPPPGDADAAAAYDLRRLLLAARATNDSTPDMDARFGQRLNALLSGDVTDELLRAARPVRESTPEQDAAFERKLDALLPNVAAKSNVLAFEPKPSVSKRRRWQLPVYAALAASFAFIMVRIVPAPDPGYRGGGTVHAMATVADPESAVSKMMLELRRLGLDPASTERNGVWKLTVQVPEQSAGAVAEVFAPFNLEHADGPLRGDVEITVLETLRE